jgi:hypothetical protein
MGSFSRKKTVFWVIAVILVIILVYFLKSSSVFTNKPQEQIVVPTPTVTAVINPCPSFTADKGEIACEEAKGIALQKYPGKLISINKVIRNYEAGQGQETQTKEAKVWIFNIRPDDQSIFPPTPKPEKNVNFLTTDTIGVVVDRVTKEILFFEPVYKN